LKIKVKGGGKVFLLEVYFIHRIWTLNFLN
jgi:hypothetical protein